MGFQSANSLRFPASFCAPYHDIGMGPKAMGSDLCGLKTWDKKKLLFRSDDVKYSLRLLKAGEHIALHSVSSSDSR